jgi:hypothetical protein
MGRIVLVVLIAIAAILYFPSSRAVVVERAGPVINPVLVMSTEREMNQIANALKEYQRENFERLPSQRQFGTWVEDKYSGDGGLDAWGERYEYTLGRDALELRSYGPDRRRGSPDDIVVTRPRRP